ncbi:MAG: hypothetical protein HC895_13560 [Leptolyngbyaceae cyanobacterium SM1_3_5]|nr:hypothetical protein [Leptolyngbyaceae cyanobacterium SM1_3_5]
MIPSSEIEQVWHYHVLDARKYAEDCQLLFGYVIHPAPYLGVSGRQDDYDQIKAYALTQVLLAKYFHGNLANLDSLPNDFEPLCSTVPLNG